METEATRATPARNTLRVNLSGFVFLVLSITAAQSEFRNPIARPHSSNKDCATDLAAAGPFFPRADPRLPNIRRAMTESQVSPPPGSVINRAGAAILKLHARAE